MAKRFTDTDKWERPWFRSLPLKYKILWCYICDKCNIAGIWYVDLDLASFLIQEKYDKKEAETYLSKQIIVEGDRWLIKDFINFQYGGLNEKNKIHNGILKKLSEFKEGAYIPLLSPIYGVKEKDKVKDKVKVKDKEKENNNISPKLPKSEEILSLFNDIVDPAIPRVQLITPKRESAIKSALKTFPDLGWWEAFFKKINNSPFLLGQNSQGWHCTFDWVINKTNLAKIQEGNYDRDASRKP